MCPSESSFVSLFMRLELNGNSVKVDVCLPFDLLQQKPDLGFRLRGRRWKLKANFNNVWKCNTLLKIFTVSGHETNLDRFITLEILNPKVRSYGYWDSVFKVQINDVQTKCVFWWQSDTMICEKFEKISNLVTSKFVTSNLQFFYVIRKVKMCLTNRSFWVA